MNFKRIISKIIIKKILQFNDLNTNDEIKQFFKLMQILNTIFSYKMNSIYFKCYGKYFCYISDSNSFYYLGNIKKNQHYITIV